MYLQSPAMTHGAAQFFGKRKANDALAILGVSIASDLIFRSLQVKPLRSLLVFDRTGTLKG